MENIEKLTSAVGTNQVSPVRKCQESSSKMILSTESTTEEKYAVFFKPSLRDSTTYYLNTPGIT